jgi:hypothetical protein
MHLLVGLPQRSLVPTCCIKSGALYIYHRKALERQLNATAGTLTAAGMPIDPDMFVVRIAAIWIQPDHPAYSIVAKRSVSSPNCVDKPSRSWPNGYIVFGR